MSDMLDPADEIAIGAPTPLADVGELKKQVAKEAESMPDGMMLYKQGFEAGWSAAMKKHDVASKRHESLMSMLHSTHKIAMEGADLAAWVARIGEHLDIKHPKWDDFEGMDK